jgi:NAD(P)-dependent dehydrogenase (short-subunit alcohol dehydrogenase family)
MAETRSVLITGSSTGIGESAALEMARRGWLVFAGVRKPEDGERLSAHKAGDLRPVMLDVTDAEAIDSVVGIVAEAVGDAGLSGVVNNAGVAVAGPLEFLSPERLRAQLEVNVVGLSAVTGAVMPLIRKGGGRIVHVGSVSGVIASPFVGPYCASKFAVEALTDSLRLELRPWGIPVSLVQPGPISTPIWDKSIGQAEKLREELPAEAVELYEPLMEAVRAEVERRAKSGYPPERIAEAIAHALTAKKPKTRYLIGPGVRTAAFVARWLPDRLRDVAIVKALGLQ